MPHAAKSVAVALTVLLCVALGPSAAHGAEIAYQLENTPIAGSQGRIAWSLYDAKRKTFKLMISAAGHAQAAPVPGRSQPFDVSLGQTRRGRPVAVYSRCRNGCRLYQYDLRTHKETRLRVSMPNGVSSVSMPAISNGQIAFVGSTRRGQPSLYLTQPSGRPAAVELPRPGGDDLHQGVRVGDAAGPTSIALRNGALAYTWEYQAQRPECGASPSAKGGSAVNSVVIVRRPGQPNDIVAHTGCPTDGALYGLSDADWTTDGLRYLAIVDQDNGAATQVHLLDRARGTTTSASVPGRMSNYGDDGKGHAIAQIDDTLVTMTPVTLAPPK
jgi:hypothetical protein